MFAIESRAYPTIGQWWTGERWTARREERATYRTRAEAVAADADEAIEIVSLTDDSADDSADD